ncbi:hypothetical protein IG557_14215 [Vibrio cholerae]|uniref:hypothetical protein n=1 Tax=Vibrio cholerae TaxID=666 RepID=UPI00226EABFF|nr:hypothetical protein [Vibrio cholerae]MCX9560020.1 hypothetical protein [Vibrio cholerae]MCX9561017.1 hypothetical protein [Vibrio cholerae]
MQVDLFSRTLQSLNVQQENNEGCHISLEKNLNNLKTIDKAQAELSKIDKQIALLDKQPASVETLAMLAAHQREVVLAMVSRNPEMAIAALLAQSIEMYGERLAEIQAWTNGGADMFDAAMSEMFDSLVASGSTDGYTLEDLFQLAVMDFMSHEYSSGGAMDSVMAHFLESTGSGSHAYHEGWDGNKFANECGALFDHMLRNAPNGSLCHDILTYMDSQCGGKNALSNQFRNNYDNAGGFVCDSDRYPSGSGLSPMLRFALMSGYLAANPNVDQATIKKFLTMPIEDLNSLIDDTTDWTSAMDFLFANDGYPEEDWAGPQGWRPVDQQGHKVIDWNGIGLSLPYFEKLYANFPARELTKEELTEVNNIGDKVRMIQETLKYWLSILRDQGLAVARNI